VQTCALPISKRFIAEDPNMGLLNYLMGFARGDPLGALEWQFPTQMWRAAPGGKGRPNLQKALRKWDEAQDHARYLGKTLGPLNPETYRAKVRAFEARTEAERVAD